MYAYMHTCICMSVIRVFMYLTYMHTYRLYVCLYRYLNVYSYSMHTYTHVYTHVCVHHAYLIGVFMYIQKYAHACTCIYIEAVLYVSCYTGSMHTYLQMYIPVCLHTFVSTCMSDTHIYKHMHNMMHEFVERQV